jgi:hypothetical protein
LTAKWDRTREGVRENIRAAQETPLLDEDQTRAACAALQQDACIDFPRVDRNKYDPIYQNQVYALFTFMPTRGARPDDQGVFGFAKIRGTFETKEEANDRAEWLIRNTDSYHPIVTTYCGKPFPVAVGNYIKETREIDIRAKATETIRERVKVMRNQEQQDVNDIKEREQRLLSESQPEYVPEPLEKYVETSVKKANLMWTYMETKKKMATMRDLIVKARQELADMDAQDPSHRERYYQQYMNARRHVSLPTDQIQDNFMKYLVEDMDFEF